MPGTRAAMMAEWQRRGNARAMTPALEIANHLLKGLR